MARYVRDVELNRPDDFVQYIMNDFLTKHRFQLVQFKGEQVYRVGGGFFEIPKFFIWSYQNGVVHIEAWTRDVWLPGVYGKEKDMTGFTGAVPKSQYKKDIEELISVLCQPLPDNGYPQMGNPGDPNGQQTVFVRGIDTSNHAKLALVFSLIGLVAGFLSPYLGILFGILAIIEGTRGKTSEKRGMAVAGLAIGIVALVISAIILILAIVALSL